MPASFKYAGEAMALIGIAYGLIKWVGRTLRSLISDRPFEESRISALSAGAPDVAGDALVRQGIVSSEQLSGMSAREREFLLANASPQASTASARAGGRRPAPTASGTVSPGPKRTMPTPTRLHLITPSRPPLGMAVHCPGCGVPLDRDALQRLGATTCQRCKRPVSAHIQRGRITVIVEETTEEAEHRRRVDGDA